MLGNQTEISTEAEWAGWAQPVLGSPCFAWLAMTRFAGRYVMWASRAAEVSNSRHTCCAMRGDNRQIPQFSTKAGAVLRANAGFLLTPRKTAASFCEVTTVSSWQWDIGIISGTKWLQGAQKHLFVQIKMRSESWMLPGTAKIYSEISSDCRGASKQCLSQGGVVHPLPRLLYRAVQDLPAPSV